MNPHTEGSDNMADAQHQGELQWQAFPAGEGGFFRAPVLLSADHEALLLDGGFTLSDGKAVADVIKKSAKALQAVYVSQSDPDYYFGLGPIKAAFPDTQVIAAPATVAAIQSSVQKKLDAWGPQLGNNGPKTLGDVVIPTALESRSLSLSGHSINIVDAVGLANRRYLWVPSLKGIFGGVLLFSGLHVWTADTPGADQRAAWLKTLDAMAALNPSVVVPGHMAIGAAYDASSISYTRDYLRTFNAEVAKASHSTELIAAMKQHYPDAGMGVALDIGAKVALGEMKWG